MIELVFYACLAVFIMIRLYSTLGSEDCTSDEAIEDAEMRKYKSVDNADSNTVVVHQDDYSNVFVNDMLEFSKIEKLIKSKVNGFLVCKFIKKAEYAFEMVLKNLYECNIENLRPLLTEKMYKNMYIKIDNMKKRENIVYKHNIVSIKECRLENLEIDYESKKIKALLHFQSEQVNCIYNRLDGSNNKNIKSVILDDQWVFVRDINSSDFNWFLDEIITEK